MLQLVFNFILGKQELESTLVAMINTLLLMPHEMLLESIAILKDFKTVRTEQVPRVFMDHSEVAIHFRIER